MQQNFTIKMIREEKQKKRTKAKRQPLPENHFSFAFEPEIKKNKTFEGSNSGRH